MTALIPIERKLLLAPSRASATNRLVTMLPSRTRIPFLADCVLIDLEFGEVLSETADSISDLYFPLDGFISLVTTLDDGHRLEVGMVGDEGMLGVSLILGVQSSPQSAMVQGAGGALKIRKAAFLKHVNKVPELEHILRRYIHVLLSQVSLSAACAHFHVLESRLARWLLNTRDRAHSSDFRLTHEFLSYMLGVRRVGITEAAAKLHDRDIIHYSRGNISILDEAALERRACACYAREKLTYDRTMYPPRSGKRLK